MHGKHKAASLLVRYSKIESIKLKEGACSMRLPMGSAIQPLNDLKFNRF